MTVLVGAGVISPDRRVPRRGRGVKHSGVSNFPAASRFRFSNEDLAVFLVGKMAHHQFLSSRCGSPNSTAKGFCLIE
jgi:hypothetical protein